MNDKLGTLGALLREAFSRASEPDPAWSAILAPADPVLASLHCGGMDDSGEDTPLVDGERRVAASRLG